MDIPGTNGEPGGIRMNYDISTAEEKPGTGKIRFDTANPADASFMFIDEAMPSGVDLSTFINSLGLGWQFMLKPNTNINNPLAIFKITGDVIDNGDWLEIPIDNQVMSSTPFTDGDKCVLQFFGGGGGTGTVTEASVVAAGNFMRAASNGAGGYKFIDNTNAELKAASQVFKLPAFTITGVSNIPAANTFPHGTVVRFHQDILVGAGANPMGVFVQADATNNIWRPFGDQYLFWKSFGTLASPTCTLNAAGMFDLGAGGNPIIPGGLLYSGARVHFVFRYKKIGATTPTIRANLGTDLAARENNSIIYTQNVSANTNREVQPFVEVSFISATSAISTSRLTVGGGGADSAMDAAITLINTAADMKATFEASTLSSDTVHLYDFSIIWRV